jgi:glycosyltransferase involved in cell wall biosynthesis
MVDVSVVVPVYNQRERLPLALASAFEQSSGGLKVEVIAVNDCSPDDSASVLADTQSSDARLKIISFQENKGAGPARNAGLDAAKGRYVTFLDPDDVYPAGALQKLIEAADSSGLALTRGNILEFDAKGTDHPRDSNATMTGAFKFADTPMLWAPWMHQQFLFKRDFLQQHAIRYPALRRGQDTVMLARALARCDAVHLVETVVYHYTIGVKSMQWGASQFDNILDHFFMVRDAYLSNGHGVPWMNYLNAYWNFWRHLQNGAVHNLSDVQLKEFLEKSATLFVEVDSVFFQLGTHKLFRLDPWRMLVYQLLRRKKFDLLLSLLRSNVRLDELLKPFDTSIWLDLLDQIADANQQIVQRVFASTSK